MDSKSLSPRIANTRMNSTKRCLEKHHLIPSRKTNNPFLSFLRMYCKNYGKNDDMSLDNAINVWMVMTRDERSAFGVTAEEQKEKKEIQKKKLEKKAKETNKKK